MRPISCRSKKSQRNEAGPATSQAVVARYRYCCGLVSVLLWFGIGTMAPYVLIRESRYYSCSQWLQVKDRIGLGSKFVMVDSLDANSGETLCKLILLTLRKIMPRRF